MDQHNTRIHDCVPKNNESQEIMLSMHICEVFDDDLSRWNETNHHGEFWSSCVTSQPVVNCLALQHSSSPRVMLIKPEFMRQGFLSTLGIPIICDPERKEINSKLPPQYRGISTFSAERMDALIR